MDSGATAYCSWSVDRLGRHGGGGAEEVNMSEEPNKTYNIGDTVALTVKYVENDSDHTGPCLKTFDVDDVLWMVRFRYENDAVLAFRDKMRNYELSRRSLTPKTYGNWARYLHVTGVVGERASGLLGAGVAEGYVLNTLEFHGLYHSNLGGKTRDEDPNARLAPDFRLKEILQLLNKKG